MNRIRNTTFNNISGDTSIGNESQLVINGINNYKKNNTLYFISENTFNYLSLSQFELSMAFASAILCGETITTNYTIFFGTDTYEFAKYIESFFGLSDKLIGVTDVVTFSIVHLPLSSIPTQTITFSSNSSTYNYLKFKHNNNISNSFRLFNATSYNTITVTGNYSSGKLQSIQFSDT